MTTRSPPTSTSDSSDTSKRHLQPHISTLLPSSIFSSPPSSLGPIPPPPAPTQPATVAAVNTQGQQGQTQAQTMPPNPSTTATAVQGSVTAHAAPLHQATVPASANQNTPQQPQSQSQSLGRARRTPLHSSMRDVGSTRSRRTRSAGSVSSLDWGSDNEENGESFSMDGYTIDLAMLGRGGVGKIGVVKNGNGNRDYPTKTPARNEAKNGKQSQETSKGMIEDEAGEVDEEKDPMKFSLADENDGPEDFTLNMGRWINGNEKWERRKAFGFNGDLDDFAESLQEPLGTSTPLPGKISGSDRKHADTADEQDASRQHQFTAQPLTGEETKEILDRISALQSEVERMGKEDEERRFSHDELARENQALRRQNIDLEHKVQEREPLFSATVPGLSSSSPSDRSKIEGGRGSENAAALASANERIETLESALEASHKTVQQLREEKSEDAEQYQVKFDGMTEDIERLRAENKTQASQFVGLEKNTLDQTKKIEEQDRIIAKMRNDVMATQTELENGHEQLRETRRIIASIEEENDRFSHSNARQAENLAELENILKGKSTELQAAHATIAQLRETSILNAQAQADGQSSTVSAKDHRRAIETLVEKHDKMVSTVQMKNTKQLQQLNKEHESQIQKLQNELSISQSAVGTEQELRSAIRVLSSKLEKANAASRTARSEAEEARQAIETAREENNLINKALEGRFVEAIEDRESEWRRRVGMLLRERDKMSKVLLNSWGKEEVGLTETGEMSKLQGYRYRHIKR